MWDERDLRGKGNFSAARLDAKAIEEFEFSEPCIQKMGEYRRDILLARSGDNAAFPKTLKQHVSKQLRLEVEKFSAPLSTEEPAADKTGARQKGREATFESLKEIDVSTETASDITAFLRVLSDPNFKETVAVAPARRQVAICLALQPNRGEQRLELLASSLMTRERVAVMAEFMSNAFKEETIAKLGFSPKAIQRIERA